MRLQPRTGAGGPELHRQQVQAGRSATIAFIFKGIIDLPQPCMKMGCGENAARLDGIGRDLFGGLEAFVFSVCLLSWKF